MQDLRIDSHKLMFHVERVADWLKGHQVCPIYLEIAPAGSCNHRCIFCAVDYLKYKPEFLDIDILKATVNQAAKLGVKSIMYAGEGEPLLHPDIVDIVTSTKKAGIDVSMTTNGVLLKDSLVKKCFKSLSWIRVSLNAGTSETYAKIHRTSQKDFDAVLQNLENAVFVKKIQKLPVTIGVQLLLIPENIGEVIILARKLKKIGVDYFSIKPYSQHPLSRSHIDAKFKYGRCLDMDKTLNALEDKKFKIIFRGETMKRLETIKDYKCCLGLPFWAYIDSHADIYSCSAFLGKKEFCYGNLYKNDFKSIMKSQRRRIVMERVSNKMDVGKCRKACRLDAINGYLWELKNPSAHVNFI